MKVRIACCQIFLLLYLSLSTSYEYCSNQEKLCSGKTFKHIVCDKEQIQPDSKYEKHYPMTNLFRKWILYWHNYYRNEVACGRSQGSEGLLPPAAQMRELSWDYELEYIASVHAGRCKMQHDKCRNTERIPISGQNLAYYKTTGTPRMALDHARRSINNWYIECKDVSESIIKSYKKLEGPIKIGHFTVMANDKVGRVGCSLTFCTSFPDKQEKWSYHYMTCNYDYTNVMDNPVYEIGSIMNCGRFQVQPSANFSCLCSNPYSMHHL